MSSGDMAAVKRLAAHRARPRRNGDAAGEGRERERERDGSEDPDRAKTRGKPVMILSFTYIIFHVQFFNVLLRN